MRQFKLKNGNGESFNLMRKDAFLSDPAGLGFGSELELSQMGSTWLLTKNTQERPEPTGQMVFAGYAQYEEFTLFLAAGNLQLGYKPLNTWLWLPCIVNLGKSEIEQTRRLLCDITFQGIGPWAERESYAQPGQEAYGLGYPRRYNYSYGKGNPGTIHIKNGTKESPFKLHLFGPAQNPAWKVYQHGKIIGTGRVITTLSAGRKLVVNSDPAHMEIAEYTTDGKYIGNRYGRSDWATQRILMLPAGESNIHTSDDLGTIKGIVEVNKLV